MHFPPALAALALLALRASAFLIPPIPSPEHVDDVAISMVPEEQVGRVKSIVAGLPHIIALSCPGCLFEGREGIENKIELQIEASHSSGLVINGVSVLPTAFGAPSTVNLSAHQVSLEDGQVTNEQPLDFALERLEAITSEETDDILIPVRFTILAVGGAPVKTDTVSVHLLRTENGTRDSELLLLDVRLIPFEDTPGAEACDGEQGWSMCRVKAIVMSRVKNLMEKMEQHRNSAHRWVKSGCGGRFSGHGGRRPERFGHHHHRGHRHWSAHRFHRVLHRSIKFFLIPALLGVIGGLMASAVGMLAAQILVYLWQKFYRGSSGAETRSRVVEIVVEDGEKVSLMAGEDLEDAPPMYKDVGTVVAEEKH